MLHFFSWRCRRSSQYLYFYEIIFNNPLIYRAHASTWCGSSYGVPPRNKARIERRVFSQCCHRGVSAHSLRGADFQSPVSLGRPWEHRTLVRNGYLETPNFSSACSIVLSMSDFLGVKSDVGSREVAMKKEGVTRLRKKGIGRIAGS